MNRGKDRRGGGGRGFGGGRGYGAGRGSGGGSGSGGGVCFEFQRTGTCKFGSRCRFRHGSGNNASLTTQRRTRVPMVRSNTSNLEDFLRHLSMSGDRLSAELEASPFKWFQCFQSHKSLSKHTRTLLVQLLAKTPPSSTLDPPDLTCCELLVEDYLKENCDSDDQTLTAVKTTYDVVERLRRFTWDIPRETVQKGLSNMIELSESKLKKRLSDHRDIGKRLMLLMDKLDQPWNIMVRFPDDEPLLEMHQTEELAFTDWKRADVRWICNPKFFSPSRCPKMLVGDAGVYDSTEAYIDTVLRLWVAMTFADGHAALAPHCRSRGNNGMACGNALWPISSATSSMRCRTRGCPYPVEFSCRIKSHDSLCLDCSTESVRQHCQGPSKVASTHVYDAEIHHCSEDGVVFIKNFASRNPPPHVHWRTTKRLSPPNLVGLVLLKQRHATLEPSDRIIWGEVVYHGDNRDEERRRQNGQLAVNVWSLHDDVDLDAFNEDSSVAVVDCMSFVPEWIPVLKALEAQQQAQLPLENGRYLNLARSNPVQRISVVNESAKPRDVFEQNHESVIQRVLNTSLLEPIKEIRRDNTLLEELVRKLTQLVKETTLDTMQFISFLDALCNPLHLTQGPPGTGKSYLGVVLVRALMIIRALWLRKSRSTASPPILVLSYKNMAINHFLIDLVQKESRTLTSTNLIRIGGNTKDMDPRLLPFSERSVYQHDFEVKQKRMVVEKLVTLRNSIENVISGGMSSFLSFQERMFGAEDHQERRKAANEFTEFLMACIVRLHVFQNLHMVQSSEGPNDPSAVLSKLSFLELDPSTLKPCNKLLHMVGRPSEPMLPMMEVKRTVGQQPHWGDLLLMWLQGRRPLPHCSHSDCSNQAVCHEVPLCDDHRCHSEIKDGQRCPTICPGSRFRFCAKHLCSSAKCNQEKLLGFQVFCRIHACRRCIEMGSTAKLALGKPPTNVCIDHSLCTFPRCNEYCVSGEICCENHLRPKCYATTKKNKPCKGTPLSRYLPYCPDHKHLRPPDWFQIADISDDSDVSDEEDGREEPPDTGEVVSVKRCTARARTGTKCAAVVLPGSTFCYEHQPPEREVNIPHNESTSTFDKTNEPEASNVQRTASTLQPTDQPTPTIIKESSFQSEQPITDDTNGIFGQEYEEMDIEGENLQHLRDVFEDPDDSSSEDSDFADADEFCSSCDDVVDDLELSTVDIPPSEWTWNMDFEARRRACVTLVDKVRREMSKASTLVKKAHSVARKELQRAKIRAKTRVYENKSIIGGTMVGCISRLESIRATRPFAIVVEEASEVLEPLLFSCLSESTVKLEMIGDHRQLQPSVMSRFDYEIMCNVNVSMFQRLIESPPGHELPSTVLSVQRRMRQNIADLTREFYRDVIDIEDHEACSIQLIGQRSSSSQNSVVGTTSTSGREVPGVAPHVFLWTHSGEQGRAQVGISRINQNEAEMACSLAKYLVQCGVPRPSIAILTPYKGQLMLIRNLLQKDRRFSVEQLLPRDKSDACRVSTVDRFQGDEEDVVIVSLVVDENSKTGFVKLANRMIVLLSRARLGCYILANKGFMGNNSSIPTHWKQTLGLLEEVGSDDAKENLVQAEDIYTSNRIGAELPLCCPVHRGNMKRVNSVDDLRLGFCTEICNSSLDCGHTCRLNCHWPKASHVSKCDIELDSPCQRHPRPIPCHTAYSNASGHPYNTRHEQILQYHHCPATVVLRLPCEHEQKVPCWKERQMMEGSRAFPACRKPSPFTFVGCGHSVNVSCEEMARYTEDPSLVQCQEKVEYEPTCGHIVKMICFERKELFDGVRSHECDVRLPVLLPRCGHEAKSVKCGLAQTIHSWTGESCVEIGTLVEGTSYGQPDHPCRKRAKIIRSCGHHVELSCAEAFCRSQSLPACREKIDARHPLCGHFCRVPCVNAAAIQSIEAPEPLNEWKEGQQQPKNPNIPFPQCHEKIELIRRCGHSETISCSKRTLPLHPCKAVVERTSPICGHRFQVPCTNGEAFDHQVWQEDVYSEILENGQLDESILKKYLRQPDANTTLVLKEMNSCKESLTVSLSCGHVKRIDCSNLGDFASGFFPKLSECNQDTLICLECGHHTTVACHVAMEYKGGKTSIGVCEAMKRQKCWNYDQCGHILSVKCSVKDVVACDALISWECPKKLHTYDLPVCSRGVPSWCPGCASDDINALADSRSEILPPKELAAIESVLPYDCIDFLRVDEGSFFTLEKQLVRKQAAMKPFEQTRIAIRRIPCFRLLQEKKELAEKFDPKSFVTKKSVFGIITKTLTKVNLEAFAEKISGTSKLLIGYATVARVNDTTARIITKKEQRSAMLKAFHSQEFDAMLYTEKNMESLVVWDPYPLIALYRISVTKEQILQLADEISDWVKPDFTPQPISMIPPAHNIFVASPSLSKDTSPDSDSASEDSDSDDQQAKVEETLVGTILASLRFDLDWSGGFSFVGEIPKANEADILQKMQFVDQTAKPFAALNRLKVLAKKYPNCAILDLLMAAEYIIHSQEKAKDHFQLYVNATRKNKGLVHPWTLVVFARLFDDFHFKALQLYASIFPNQTMILREAELEFIRRDGIQNEIESRSWHDQICDDWKNIQTDNPGKTNSPSTDTLVNLTGLRKVKEQVLKLWKSAIQLSRMKDPETRKKNSFVCNYIFVGNPGTGKTTVARLLAKILHDCGMRPQSTIVETTAQAEKDGGTAEFRQKVSGALGGCFFIDEAYDLDPIGDLSGKPIVNELLTLSEDKRDDISFILAGYEDDFERKFFAYNDGLRSRFKTMAFEDFDEQELATIWNRMREDKGWNEDKDVCRVVVRRMVKMAGKKGFGNAREVRRRLEEATQSAMSRLGDELDDSNMKISIEDVIGEDPRLQNEKLKRVVDEIEEKIGWHRVKQQVKELLEICGVNYRRELLGQSQLDIFLNRLFLGNPGTGKTTCAKLYGRLLKELGFLSNGDIVSKTASDFVGQHVGESQTKTSQILENSKGKVLIIDECYALDDSLFGKQVLDTIVEKVHGSPLEDIAVLLLGYESHMVKMITNQNPGLNRRFPKDQAFYFDDYSDNELLSIMDLNLKKNQVSATVEFREKFLEVLQAKRKQTNFGNAGDAEQLVKAAILKAAKRDTSAKSMILGDIDIDDPGSARADKAADPLSALNSLFKMDKVKAKLDKMRKTWVVAKQDGDEQPNLGHFVFTGSPGTGKTTVARTIASVLFSLGLMPSDKIVEKSALDLTAGYVGQTKDKVNSFLEESKGGVLFIDEAYNLGIGHFGKEACDTLVAAMTSEMFCDVVIVIAGYPDEIDDMLKSNPGLKSRFNHFFEFPDWEAKDCVEFLQILADGENFEIEDLVLDDFEAGCCELRKLDGWGNGRDVTKLWDMAKSNRGVRVYESGETRKIISMEDILGALNELLEARRRRERSATPSQDAECSDPPMATASESCEPPRFQTDTSMQKTTNLQTATDESEDESLISEKADLDKDDDYGRDDGVPDEVWKELQNAVRRQKEQQEALARQEVAYQQFLQEQKQRDDEARRLHEENLERIRHEAEIQEQQRLIQLALEAEKQRRHKEELERRRRERVLQEQRERERKRVETQRRLRAIGRCPAGFEWFHCGAGWRCGGGSHFVSDEELRTRFGRDI